jgi:hypothetical protein
MPCFHARFSVSILWLMFGLILDILFDDLPPIGFVNPRCCFSFLVSYVRSKIVTYLLKYLDVLSCNIP